jgi:hypothetical protein
LLSISKHAITPLAQLTNSSSPLSVGSQGSGYDELRLQKWITLVDKYGEDRLMKHQWEWLGCTWVPHYEFQTVTSFQELWSEYADGISGYLPVRDLQERWASKPAWHRNLPRKKTEAGRRKKVSRLIEELAKKPRWGVDHALKFLESTYGKKHTAGTFARWLSESKNGKDSNLRTVMDEASRYKA